MRIHDDLADMHHRKNGFTLPMLFLNKSNKKKNTTTAERTKYTKQHDSIAFKNGINKPRKDKSGKDPK